MIDIPKIVSALVLAERAAIEADPGPDADGGSCNFDSPVLTLPGARAATVAKIAKEAGVELSETTWLGKRRWFVRTTTNGQANRRSRMAEAACRVLRNAGLDAMMFYHAD